MSNTERRLEAGCSWEESSCNSIELIIKPRLRNLGNFTVRRVLPFAKRRMVGPWTFFDHAGPAYFLAGQGLDVRPHPHTCLATVTYLFEGELLHRDSVGSVQTIRPGDINMMVAGSGVTHSERTPQEVREKEHTLHALQLWLALPDTYEETEPAFYHYPATDLPTVTVNNVPIRVMIGSAYGITSPVKTFSQTLYAEAYLQAGQSITLPKTEECAAYVAKGIVHTKNTEIPEHSMAVFSPQKDITLIAKKETQLAIIGGAPVGERFMEWNFVASSKKRIEKAKQDWKEGNFPTIPDDNKEFIPLPE